MGSQRSTIRALSTLLMLSGLGVACGGTGQPTITAATSGAAGVRSDQPVTGDSGTSRHGAIVRGHIIVADNGARVLDVDPGTGTVTLVSSDDKSTAAGREALMSDLYGIAEEADGNFLVIARRGSADAGPNTNPSRLIRIDSRTGAESLVTGDPQLHYGLTSLTVAPNGDIYVGDEDVPDPRFNGGVVYRVDPHSGALSVLTSNSKSAQAGGAHELAAPLGLAVEPDGGLWVLADNSCDENAPDTPNDCVGAVVHVDRPTGKQTVFTSNHISTTHGGEALFADPRAFVRTSNGDFYVVDDAAINDPKFGADDTKVVKIDHITGAETLVSSNDRSARHGGQRLFNRPYGIAIGLDGELFVGDGDRLVRVDPTTGVQRILASGMGNAIGVIVAT